MEGAASPLIHTKLGAPAARPHVVSRTRLMARLRPEAGGKLTLVCAPAGYGKSTLLAEWARSLRQQGVAVAWYALDPSDDAPGPFGAYLLASLSQALGPIPELTNLAQRLRSSPEPDLRRILPTLINAVAASSQMCALILDDYHLISSPAIHAALAALVEQLPPNLRIIIGSRADPPLHLARLRVRGQLVEVRAPDLRFTPAETALFLNDVMRLDLLPPLIAQLEARTEGWIAGLQLAALSLAGRPDREDFVASFSGSHHYLVEYLLEEVVGRLEDGAQAFLLSTSVLERFCAPLCDAVCESGGSEETLAQLARANLFLVALDDEGRWHRYHHLFRDFLQARLQKTQPGRAPKLHRLASEWYAGHGFLTEAVRHAFQTEDWDYAADMVERLSFPMLMRSELATIHEWCAVFPEMVMRRHPLLCIQESWTLVLGARRQNRGRVETRLRQVEQAAAALEDREAGAALVEHAETVRAYLAMLPDPRIDAAAQLDLASRQLAAYSEENSARFSALLTVGYAQMALQDAAAAACALEAARELALGEPLPYGIVETTFELARLRYGQGQLHAATELCREGQAQMTSLLAGAEYEMPALGCLDVALGEALMEENRLAEAEECLTRGFDTIGWRANVYAQAIACLALHRLREIQGRSTEALDYLARLEQAWPDVALCVEGMRVAHALRAPSTDARALRAAAAWTDRFSPILAQTPWPFGMGPLGAVQLYYLASLAWIKAQIILDGATATRRYLEQQLALSAANGLALRVVELSLLEALAAAQAGDAARQWTALERALVTGQAARMRRVFDQGPACARLLTEARQRGICADYAGEIVAMLGEAREAGGAAPGVSPAGERLSERELEVLRLMAQGASNGEIAERLVITVGTVKSHINHILGKLAARNRTEAVAHARQAGLL